MDFSPTKWIMTVACMAMLLTGSTTVAADRPTIGTFESLASWEVESGHATLTFDHAALTALGITAPEGGVVISPIEATSSTFQLTLIDEQPNSSSGAIVTHGGASLQVGGSETDRRELGNFSVSISGRNVSVIDHLDVQRLFVQSPANSAIVDIDPAGRRITVVSDLVISDSFAVEVLGDKAVAGTLVGQLEITGDVVPGDIQIFDTQTNTTATPRAGPDVIVGALTGDTSGGHPRSYGQSGGIYAYSVGTTSCNTGTVPLDWFDGVPNGHPVIGQSLFRLKTEPGTNYQRFEQIGQAWLKYGFCALQQTLCSGAGGCSPVCGGCCNRLGVGCSDPYTAARNGNWGDLGAKHPVNPYLGTFPDPPQRPSGPTNIRGRIQAHGDDVNPALNAGALYFVEGHYIAHDDSLAGNQHNNASWRRATMLNNANFSLNWVTGAFPGAQTVREEAAIYAWQAYDPAVTITPFDVPSDGRFFLGYKVTDNGDGTWHYEYALQNLNCHRSAQFFSVATPECIGVSNLGFHDVFYHSGEPFDGTDWPGAILQDQVIWATTQTFNQNPNANALRYGTLYNFRFDAATPPTSGNIKIGLFRPGTPSFVTVTAQVPSDISCVRGDLNGDGLVDAGDIARFVEILISGVGSPIEKCSGDLEFIRDCEVGFSDVTHFVNCLIAGGC